MVRSTRTTVDVALVVVPETAPAALYGLHEVFSFTGSAWEEMTGRPAGAARMRSRFVGAVRGQLTCALGSPVMVEAGFDEAPRCDVAIATDLALGPLDDPCGRWPAAADWLRRQHAGGSLVCSVCTGSLLLAEAGLLDGLEATTHWAAVPLFRSHYPRVRLAPERIVVPAGAEHRIITSGGHAAWADLALYLIARFCGQQEALHTAKVFLLGDRSEGQLPFAAMVKPRAHDDGAVGRSQLWIADHYAAPNPVARMAEVSGLASRTFVRRFRAATGHSPIDYVQTLRIEEAKHLLESTPAPADEVGAQVGYRDSAAFRRVFKRRTGVTPARYRQRFGMPR